MTDARNIFLRTLVGDVRRLDDTRLVSAALLVERGRERRSPRDDAGRSAGRVLDVMAINTYNGWYSQDRLADLARSEWRVPPTSADLLGIRRRCPGGLPRSANKQKFSEEYQADYYRATLNMADSVPTLRGMSPWILKDFRSPRRQNPDFQQGWNRKGLISETGQRKEAFGVLSDYYGTKVGQR